MPSRALELVSEYTASKEAYDEALELVLSLGKIPFEGARLAARRRIHARGLRLPEVILLEYWASLGWQPPRDLE